MGREREGCWENLVVSIHLGHLSSHLSWVWELTGTKETAHDSSHLLFTEPVHLCVSKIITSRKLSAEEASQFLVKLMVSIVLCLWWLSRWRYLILILFFLHVILEDILENVLGEGPGGDGLERLSALCLSKGPKLGFWSLHWATHNFS